MSLRLCIAVVLMSLLTSGCVGHPKVSLPQTLESEEVPILFVADPQLHNVYGVGLKQMLRAADFVSRVAIRPPELNLLAGHALHDLIRQATSAAGKRPILVVLGDLTNIACSGEFDDFVSLMNKAWGQDLLWFAAHGNHDTYLMGTANTYIPADGVPQWQPVLMPSSPLPTDESWWGPHQPPQGARNWRDGCYRPHDDSAPMNKVRWLAKYLALLQRHGLHQFSSTENASVTPLNFTATKGPLLDLRFQVRGQWVRPVFGPEPSNTDFLRSYRSFIVQTADVTPQHRLIIIDTAVCEYAPGGPRFALLNAGSNACVGGDQLKIIDQLVKEMPADRHAIFAGHFPLDDFRPGERDEFIRIMSQRGPWSYVSAHTHRASAAYDWNSGTEINIGSTTDWPMEAHLLYPAKGASAFASRTSFYVARFVGRDYVPARASRVTELCRHLPVARALAKLDVSNVPQPWKSPEPEQGCDPMSREEWEKRGAELRRYIEKISTRFSSVEYRRIVLGIAAAASRQEQSTFHLLGTLPR